VSRRLTTHVAVIACLLVIYAIAFHYAKRFEAEMLTPNACMPEAPTVCQ
jgi:hypothetical protein